MGRSLLSSAQSSAMSGCAAHQCTHRRRNTMNAIRSAIVNRIKSNNSHLDITPFFSHPPRLNHGVIPLSAPQLSKQGIHLFIALEGGECAFEI
jgi:hypothetical protein